MENTGASSSGLDKTLSHLIECNVCKEPAKQQKVLACQHSMCIPCVKKLIIERRRFKCSLCNKVNLMPNGGLDDLPDSLIAKQLADLMVKDENISATVDDLDANPVAQSKEILGSEDTSENIHVDSQTIDPSTKPKQVPPARTTFTVPTPDPEPQPDPKVARKAEKQKRKKVEKLKKLKNGAEGFLNEFDSLKRTHERKRTILEQDIGKTKEAVENYRKEIEKLCNEKIEALENHEASRKAKWQRSEENYQEDASRIKELLHSNMTLLKSLNYPKRIHGQQKTTFSDETIEKVTSLTNALKEIPKVDHTDGMEDFCYINRPKPGDSVSLALECPEKGQAMTDFINTAVHHASVGVVIGEIKIDYNTEYQVVFPGNINWVGCSRLLRRTDAVCNVPYIGDRVRVKHVDGIHLSWRSRSVAGKHGYLREIQKSEDSREDDLRVVVDFPDQPDHLIELSVLEKVHNPTFEVGDKVRLKDEPTHGWQELNGSSVGTVKTLDEDSIEVNFPGCPSWKGMLADLEHYRTPGRDDNVQVKLNIEKPTLDWSGMTHDSVGTLEEIVRDRKLGKLAKIKFKDRTIPWYCLYDEIEVERYKKPKPKPAKAEHTDKDKTDDEDDDDTSDEENTPIRYYADSDYDDDVNYYDSGLRYYQDEDSDDGHSPDYLRLMIQASLMNRVMP